MSDFDPDRHQQTHAAIRAYYLSLPGKTEDGWKAIAQTPSQFNRVWNHMMGLPPSDKPPQIDYQTGEIKP